jgi:hypothetical protein
MREVMALSPGTTRERYLQRIDPPGSRSMMSSQPPLSIQARWIIGDFYDADLIRVSGGTYVIAASSVGMHWQPYALVFAIGDAMKLNAACHFRANYTL